MAPVPNKSPIRLLIRRLLQNTRPQPVTEAQPVTDGRINWAELIELVDRDQARLESLTPQERESQVLMEEAEFRAICDAS
jgi:hypothetical protein